MLHPLPPPGSKDDGSIDFPALARNSRDGEWEVLSFPAWAKALQQLEIYNAGPQHLATVEERRVRLADQWLRFSPGGKVGRFTNEAVVYLMDIFPIATDRMGALELSRLEKEGRVRDRSVEGLRGEEVFRWSTLTMTIDLKTRLPPAGVEWLYTRVTNMSLRGGRADVQFVTLDQDGEVIVLSSQTMLAVDVARRFGRQQPSIEKL
ncbi:thioesterase-like superfamily-domain-containing protein [Aspergillus karnatakaensis]|uniref:thioesterase-like superfamily-domain-containing protein n=1 Tax=Aspergillus karnatakaensis TaxID=1810916 RepID=UPI003CCC9004